MKLFCALLFAFFGALPAAAALSRFEHVVIVVQENRTPDNLFYVLCKEKPCSTHPDGHQYDIQTSGWLDDDAEGGTINPSPLPLYIPHGPSHTHEAFVAMCDFNSATGTCNMDGAGGILCKRCAPNTPFTYVGNTHGEIKPYLVIAENYGWANYMFQTNQGPSFPAHQFLFGGTSAPSKRDDHKGTFDAENAQNGVKINGCIAAPGTTTPLINAKGIEFKNVYPCFEHQTLGDLLGTARVSWRYYTPGAGDLWSAPDAIRHICKPSNGVCTGPIWNRHVAVYPPEVLLDLKKCALAQVSWVIPSGQYSDHAAADTGSGPNWVANVVDAIGNSSCRNADGTSYWESTAIVVTWDDWGGFYDHEPPTFLPYPQGGYQYGFRVPMLFVSAYTPKGYINNERLDFGSIARFVEHNFGIPLGSLTFADARSTTDLAKFYNLSAAPRPFETIPAGPFGGPDDKLEPPDDD